MSTSSILKTECTKCKKIAVEESRLKLGSTILIKLTCGHLISYASSVQDNTVYEKIIFSDNCKPRQYQIDAMKFAEEANFNCIIADEQGLGKTIESLSLLRLHPEKLLPAVVVVPTTVKLQWMWEIDRICVAGDESKKSTFLTQVIQSGKEKAMPGFGIYIVTFDMLKKDDLFEYVPNIKTIIIDECQRIKNHLSDRAKAVQRIAKSCQYRIPMSGTPIKNNAGEYFTVLNLVAPSMFPNYQRYIDTYCDNYHNGWSLKIGGLKDAKRFHEDTKDIIIRRTKAEVLKDLPSIERKFYHVELDRKLNKVYAAAMQELEDLYYGEMSSFERAMAEIAIMSKLRHISGISKVSECVDFVTEFLLSSDRKITIFVHHNDTSQMLDAQLSQWCSDGGYSKPLVLHSGLNGDERAELVKTFKETSSRILIASTLAAGEGLNLQFCSDAVILERQWNPANEEQAEARFHRFGQQNNVSITYIIAIETIDEYFTELVEKKRSIVAATMDNKEIPWDQQSLMKELANTLMVKGKRKWSL
jgi:SWI/SNF-related matrix-associated actin-dependent regulator of chromatin subfamily A-like protein 1